MLLKIELKENCILNGIRRARVCYVKELELMTLYTYTVPLIQ